ncbi:hypothetical protein [Caldimonas tepidiphila]|uniref:hypothetical protein n=1 Tax=Caldimonas tepidiphila TaxID=2315841 RepID=UPI0013005BEE|nr:hypothetical protein [Caldimonas tepidiphila]
MILLFSPLLWWAAFAPLPLAFLAVSRRSERDAADIEAACLRFARSMSAGANHP